MLAHVVEENPSPLRASTPINQLSLTDLSLNGGHSYWPNISSTLTTEKSSHTEFQNDVSIPQSLIVVLEISISVCLVASLSFVMYLICIQLSRAVNRRRLLNLITTIDTSWL